MEVSNVALLPYQGSLSCLALAAKSYCPVLDQMLTYVAHCILDGWSDRLIDI